jgi:hypothetical protein
MDLEQQIGRFEKQPWRSVPIGADGEVGCCLGKSTFFVRTVFRAPQLVFWFVGKPPAWARRHPNLAMPIVIVLLVFAFVVSGFIELVHTIWSNFMRLLLVLLLLVGLVMPTATMAWFPEQYNALTAFLLSVGLSAISIWTSYDIASWSGQMTADKKWLPAAEGACNRLLTLRCHVKKFERRLLDTCCQSTTQLPELNQPENRATKIFVDQQCNNGATQLADIANQLDSAYQDWDRFIRQNCQEGECDGIFKALNQTRMRLEREIAQCSSPRPEVAGDSTGQIVERKAHEDKTLHGAHLRASSSSSATI